MFVQFFFTTLPGIEDVLVREIKEKFRIKARQLDKGIAVCRARPEKTFLFNFLLKSCLRTGFLLKKGKFKTLDDVYSLTRSIPWPEYISSGQSFAIHCQREGHHPWISFDLERSAGQAVIDTFRDKKKKAPGVDLKNPDVQVFIKVRNRNFFMGIDTTGQELNRRGYKEYFHRAGLNPVLAYALLDISGWDKRYSLSDPFCGAGTILIEAYRKALNIPNLEREKSFILWKLKFLPHDLFREQARRIKSGIKKEKLELDGSDISTGSVEGARLNMRSSKTRANISLADATVVRFGQDYVVTNPPFGMRLGSKAKVHKTLKKFKKNLLKSKDKWKNTTLLTLTPRLFREFKFKKGVSYGPERVYIMRYR